MGTTNDPITSGTRDDVAIAAGPHNRAAHLDALSERLDDLEDAGRAPDVPASVDDANDAEAPLPILERHNPELTCLLLRQGSDAERVLSAVYQRPGTTATELCDVLKLEQARVLECLIELEAYHLVVYTLTTKPASWVHGPLAHEAVRRLLATSTDRNVAVAVTKHSHVLTVIDLAPVQSGFLRNGADARRERERELERATRRERMVQPPYAAEQTVDVVDDVTPTEARFARPFAIECLRQLALQIDEDTRDEWIVALTDVLVTHSRFLEQHRDEVLRPEVES